MIISLDPGKRNVLIKGNLIKDYDIRYYYWLSLYRLIYIYMLIIIYKIFKIFNMYYIINVFFSHFLLILFEIILIING